MSKVAVVGGGAAGMMAAYAAAECGHRVTLYEQNEKLGKKVYITGKGRCNVTNACETEELFLSFVQNSKFLYSAVYGFDNQSVMGFFEEQGVPLKIERGNRVFPVSDHSSDIIRGMERALKRKNVQISYLSKVSEILTEDSDENGSKVCGIIVAVGRGSTETKRVQADAVIMACGGLSYASTGSDGSGFELLRKLGHSTTEFRPSLTGVRTLESYITQLQGLSLKNITFRMMNGKKVIYEEFGELLFTHQGMSGPVVLTATSRVKDKFWKEPISFEIDLKAALNEEQLDKRLQRDFKENQNKQFKNALNGLLPSKLIPIIIELSHIPEDKPVNVVTREERSDLVHLLKHFPGTITGLCDWNEAIITRGGIKVKEVNPSTMESKLVKNLYICGEMLDVDAVTGGYNLQIAWSTGHLAGSSVDLI